MIVMLFEENKKAKKKACLTVHLYCIKKLWMDT